MNARMSKWMIAVAVAALGSVACDPYPKENTSAPRVDRVLAVGDSVVDVEFPGPYVLDVGEWGSLAFIVQFNKPMDGLSIQSEPTTKSDGTANTSIHVCDPAAGLTITPAGPVGTYYTCYYPSTPDTTSGSQLILQTVPGSSRTSGSFFPGGVDYHLTGTVKDLQGNPLAIDATFRVAVGAAAAPALTPSAGSVVVDWTAVTNATTYDVQRAPDVTGAAGTYADVATGLTALTYTDTVAAGTYWYRIVSHGGNGTSTPGLEASVVVP